ncbi:uncharacterized protein TNCV_2273931 [Trichonephila clavipes]|nr:uncharacterized protein TNCV_2273931 [Trichonephila clavipes]
MILMIGLTKTRHPGCSNIARAKKVTRFNETFPQAELRRLEQAEREAAHRAVPSSASSAGDLMASQRDTETIAATESRQRAVAERAQQRRLIFTRNTGEGYSIKLHLNRVPRGEYERQFNAPTTNEIAAVVVSSERTASRDIVIQAPDGWLTRVPDTHRFYGAHARVPDNFLERTRLIRF